MPSRDASYRRWLLPLALALAAILVRSATVHAGILDASWTEPTTNVDGSPLTDLAAYRLYYELADAGCSGPTFAEVAAASARPAADSTVTYRLTGLSSGTSYFVSVTAVDASGNESGCVSPAHSAVARIGVSVSPTATTTFGNVLLGGVAERTFTVKNTGGGTVSGTVRTAAPFRVAAGGTFSLAGVGATQAVTVQFRPTVVAMASASIAFTMDDGGTVARIVTGTGVAADSTPPTVAIVSPTPASTFRTTRSSLTLAGTAADDVGLFRVTWKNSRGGRGTASGTSAWTVTGIPLEMGTNVLTITARDTAGKIATARLTVTRIEPTPPVVSSTAPAAGSTGHRATSAEVSVSERARVTVSERTRGDDKETGP